MTTYCILDSDNVIVTTFACSQLPTTQVGYTELPVDGGNVGDSWTQAGTLISGALALAQTAQNNLLYSVYETQYQLHVSYTSIGGITETYQADDDSVAVLMKMLAAWQSLGACPPGFYWVAEDNTKVPFTFADMEGLAVVIGNQGAANFAHLQVRKAEVNAALTVADVQLITW